MPRDSGGGTSGTGLGVHPFDEVGRAAFAQRNWSWARECLTQVRAANGLDGDDFFALADCAWWLGDIDAALDAYEEA